MIPLGTSDLAIDLGTSNTLVVVRGRGIVVDEPSVVAVERMGGAQRVVAIGHDAKQMVGRTPENIEAIHPIQDGVIVDFDLAEALLRSCIERALGARPFVKPRIVVCVPNRLQDVERRAIQEAARAATATFDGDSEIAPKITFDQAMISLGVFARDQAQSREAAPAAAALFHRWRLLHLWEFDRVGGRSIFVTIHWSHHLRAAASDAEQRHVEQRRTHRPLQQ